MAFQTTDHNVRPETDLPGSYRSSAVIPARFLNRRSYMIALSFGLPPLRTVLLRREYMSFTVSGVGYHGSDFPEPWAGVVAPAIEWQLEQLPSSDDGSHSDGPKRAAEPSDQQVP
jgi:hypothetical protein